MKSYITVGLVLAVLALSVVQSFQIKSLKSDISNIQGSVVQGSGALDTSSWTETEKMEYEHHGTLPARLQGNAPAPSNGAAMVGGC